MFLVVRCQHASGACQSHSHLVLSLREASRKYVELSPSTPPFQTLRFHEKDLTPTQNLLRIRLILPPLGHVLSVSPNANHQDKTSSLFTNDRVAKPLPTAAQTLKDPHFEESESQQPFFDCITQVWHQHIHLYARQLEGYSDEAH
jgi:hypothetical protein